MKLLHAIDLLTPPMPDHIQYQRPAGKRQDGINFNDKGIPVGELTELQANDYAELLKAKFLEHWKQKFDAK